MQDTHTLSLSLSFCRPQILYAIEEYLLQKLPNVIVSLEVCRFQLYLKKNEFKIISFCNFISVPIGAHADAQLLHYLKLNGTSVEMSFTRTMFHHTKSLLSYISFWIQLYLFTICIWMSINPSNHYLQTIEKPKSI